MKTILSALLMLTISVGIYAQKDVTKFLGIPVDGTKTEMIQKLKAKGFVYDSVLGVLKGEFNGYDVYVFVITNNNKVCRIVVMDVARTNEINIKLEYNKLLGQFLNNKKYIPSRTYEMLDEKENISYEILVNKKRYEAGFYQLPEGGLDLAEAQNVENKLVWFKLDKDDYGEYYKVIFYDNKYNSSNGEDL